VSGTNGNGGALPSRGPNRDLYSVAPGRCGLLPGMAAGKQGDFDSKIRADGAFIEIAFVAKARFNFRECLSLSSNSTSNPARSARLRRASRAMTWPSR